MARATANSEMMAITMKYAFTRCRLMVTGSVNQSTKLTKGGTRADL